MEDLRYRSTTRGKKEVRRLSGVAHERALRAALESLESKFALWRKGELDTFALNDSIHVYHHKEQREIWHIYQQKMEPTAVARAVADGLLNESDLSPQLLEDLRQSIAYFRER